jgi:hypothetical protein
MSYFSTSGGAAHKYIDTSQPVWGVRGLGDIPTRSIRGLGCMGYGPPGSKSMGCGGMGAAEAAADAAKGACEGYAYGVDKVAAEFAAMSGKSTKAVMDAVRDAAVKQGKNLDSACSEMVLMATSPKMKASEVARPLPKETFPGNATAAMAAARGLAKSSSLFKVASDASAPQRPAVRIPLRGLGGTSAIATYAPDGFQMMNDFDRASLLTEGLPYQVVPDTAIQAGGFCYLADHGPGTVNGTGAVMQWMQAGFFVGVVRMAKTCPSSVLHVFRMNLEELKAARYRPEVELIGLPYNDPPTKVTWSKYNLDAAPTPINTTLPPVEITSLLCPDGTLPNPLTGGCSGGALPVAVPDLYCPGGGRISAVPGSKCADGSTPTAQPQTENAGVDWKMIAFFGIVAAAVYGVAHVAGKSKGAYLCLPAAASSREMPGAGSWTRCSARSAAPLRPTPGRCRTPFCRGCRGSRRTSCPRWGRPSPRTGRASRRTSPAVDRPSATLRRPSCASPAGSTCASGTHSCPGGPMPSAGSASPRPARRTATAGRPRATSAPSHASAPPPPRPTSPRRRPPPSRCSVSTTRPTSTT